MNIQMTSQVYLTTEVKLKIDFAFTTQANKHKGWGMGMLVSQAQDMFWDEIAYNNVNNRNIK